MQLNAEQKEKLVTAAIQARHWAYAPYSNYQVGAAVLTESGKIYDGVNVENAAYPAGICAERVAVFKAVSEGELRFRAVAVVTADAGSPCGVCRQVISEFGLDTIIVLADEHGNVRKEVPLSELLPDAFTPASLEK